MRWWCCCSPRVTHRSWCSGCTQAVSYPSLRARIPQLHEQGGRSRCRCRFLTGRAAGGRPGSGELTRPPRCTGIPITPPFSARPTSLRGHGRPGANRHGDAGQRLWTRWSRCGGTLAAPRLGAWQLDEGYRSRICSRGSCRPGGCSQARTPAAYTAHLMDLKVAVSRTGARAAHGARTRVDTASGPSPAEASAGRSGGPRRPPMPRIRRSVCRCRVGRCSGSTARRGPAPRAAGCGDPRPPTVRRCSTTTTSTWSTTSTPRPRRPLRARPSPRGRAAGVSMANGLSSGS